LLLQALGVDYRSGPRVLLPSFGGIVKEAGWPTIAVIGAGAVGCYFGGLLARGGAPVTLIGRARHVEAINRDGLLLERNDFRGHIAISASTGLEAARGAEIVLLCVKTPDTEETVRQLAPHLSSQAAVLSLQNGVDNVERIRLVVDRDIIPTVVYVGAEMTAPGCVKHTARGELVIGALPGQERVRERLAGIAVFFERAGIPCRISDDIEADLWMKLVINCACNAVSALCRARYGQMASHPETRAVMRQVVEEAVAVARGAGVRLPEIDYVQQVWNLVETMPATLSSTAQDIDRGKRTEIDSLNGYVSRRGVRLGIATPVNQTLYALVKLLEEKKSHESQR
jgi:2-dehydropantoate 2-reductase